MASTNSKKNIADALKKAKVMNQDVYPEVNFSTEQPVPGASDSELKKKKRKKVPIDMLVANEYNEFDMSDEETLEALATVIAVDGISNTIVTTPQPDGKFRILSGHRRFCAAKKAGIEEVEIWIQPEFTVSDEIAYMFRQNVGGRKDDPFGQALTIKRYNEVQDQLSEEERISAAAKFGLPASSMHYLNGMATYLNRDVLKIGQLKYFTKQQANMLVDIVKTKPTVGKRIQAGIVEVYESDASQEEKVQQIKALISAREPEVKKEKKQINAFNAVKSANKYLAEVTSPAFKLPLKKERRQELRSMCEKLIASAQECIDRLDSQ